MNIIVFTYIKPYTDYILLFFNYSLQATVLCIIVYWNVCITVSHVHEKSILKIALHKLLLQCLNNSAVQFNSDS